MSFKDSLLRVGRPTAKSTYGIHNLIGLTFLTRLRLGLSHLHEHMFKHSVKYCVNPLCSCSLEIEYPSHFFLHCHYFTNIRSTLNIPRFSDSEIVELSLYGGSKFDLNQNTKILSSSISFILKSEKFNGSFFKKRSDISRSYCSKPPLIFNF